MCVSMLLILAVSCSRRDETVSGTFDANALETVGSLSIYPSDVAFRLKDKYDGRTDEAARSNALHDLVRRAHYAQAALDAGLAEDPVVRQEVARLLEIRYREEVVRPRLKALMDVPEERLREIYESQRERFQSPEKRQVAVLRLNPGPDPERQQAYREKLTRAREWYLHESDLDQQPEKGFSVLSVDHSEHHATRYKGGVVGWLQREGGTGAWKQAVADIVFSLEQPGSVSDVIERPEGMFLVRYMAQTPTIQKPFAAVSDMLANEERSRLRNRFETDHFEMLQRENGLRAVDSE